ncbi:MAG: glycosyltransferase family 2 protein [Pirellulales bacterium]|nr:glycosyltransferase family 2 protein [Pirellulales bacterium]
MSIQLTAAVIALNEAAQVQALAQALHWVDEVLLVDGGSLDGTAELAARLGMRVLHRTFDNFANQRNYALQRARGEWLLSLDADERPTPALARAVREAIRTTRCAGFRVPIRSRILGRTFRFSGTQDDRPVRLVRRKLACWEGTVHERLCVAGRVGTLPAWLEHETIPTVASFLAKMRHYTQLQAEGRVAAGIPPRRSEAWLAPLREVFRRLYVKWGVCDGPQGWAFALLSGLSAHVLARRHWQLWQAAHGRHAVRKTMPLAHLAELLPRPFVGLRPHPSRRALEA